ncbi:hypothetical protein SWZG_00267 [Synechococcus phage S-SKS1]|uniref:Base plate wedge component n=1 Tax=Synechococcus phage S-SKS1 TaxID=754042 RepID=M4R1X8_9CAUD|nr:baseplate wedge subunit [Synechococcus phage S-SKS1]AGH31772.1 hypothetical protein SWZG_00267 [Synechococcus phage S-SKS1]
MGYFRELPDVEYQSFLSDAISSQDYLKVKNLFRRNKVRDDLQNVFTLFNKYEIVEGARPDTVAEEFYGKADLDWVVLMTAGIINVRDEWPLSNYQLYKYAENKYSVENLSDINYYETKEVKDSNGRLILPAGKDVNEDFTLNYSDNGIKVSVSGISVRRGVSNWEYETIKNNKKSSIYLLKQGYLQQFLNDMREIMTYGLSSEYVNESLIRTENTKVTTSY